MRLRSNLKVEKSLFETDEESDSAFPLTESEKELLSEEHSDTLPHTQTPGFPTNYDKRIHKWPESRPRSRNSNEHSCNAIRTPKEMILRTVYGLIMVASYLTLIFIGFFPLAIVILILQLLIFKELIGIAHTPSLELKLPWFRCITWYFLICSLYYLYGENVFEVMQQTSLFHSANHLLAGLLEYHKFISYLLHSFGFVIFVLNLRKGHYRFQFRQLGFTLLVLLMIFYQSKCFLESLFQGRIWVVLPTSLVIVNDIAAYFFGKAFGRTPLIKVSPKKTVEGFIGGMICTVIWAFLFSRFLLLFPQLLCPYDKIHGGNDCQAYVGQLFQLKTYVLSEKFSFSFNAYPIQIHALIMAMFASVIAPFGGFFASGFKRANKIKDFASSIPGHGGVTDRMDCQLLMGMFSYLYLQSFLRYEPPVHRMFKLIIKRLSPIQIQQLIHQLEQVLHYQ